MWCEKIIFITQSQYCERDCKCIKFLQKNLRVSSCAHAYVIGENALQITLNPQHYIDNTYKRAGYFPPYEYYVISIAVMDRTQNKSSIPFFHLLNSFRSGVFYSFSTSLHAWIIACVVAFPRFPLFRAVVPRNSSPTATGHVYYCIWKKFVCYSHFRHTISLRGTDLTGRCCNRR